MPTDLSAASPTLRERLYSKIVQPGPATPCATWVGAYNRHGLRRARRLFHRPVVRLGAVGSPVVYVAPALLTLAGITPDRPDQTEACHTCPTGTPPDGVYRCVDLDHLQWGSREENDGNHRRRQ
jgi:hypothetical protein